jgi:Tol biopolymer transport system component
MLRRLLWTASVAAVLLLTNACADSTGPAGGAHGRLAFASNRDGNWNIYSARPDGGDVRRLTADAATDIQPAFSTDRRRIAFYSEREPAGIYIMNTDGSGVRYLYTVGAPLGAEQLSWAPDDRRIVFQGPASSWGGFAVHVLDVEQGTATRIRVDAGSPAWSPDGSSIAFTDTNLGGIWLMRPDGSDARQILAEGTDPAWSPDGQRIAFVSERDGPLNVYTAASDGSGVTRVTNALGVLDRGPVWSPDGDRIAFTRESFPTADVWTVGADGADVRRVTTGPSTNGGVAW